MNEKVKKILFILLLCGIILFFSYKKTVDTAGLSENVIVVSTAHPDARKTEGFYI